MGREVRPEAVGRMSAATSTIEQVTNCLQAAYDSDHEIERLAYSLVRELAKFDALCAYVHDAGDCKLHSDETDGALVALVGEIVDSRAAHR